MEHDHGTVGPAAATGGEPLRQQYETLFLEHLGTLRRAIGAVSRRRGLEALAEDFASWVMVRIIRDDYAVLRAYRGGSGVATYLYAVVENLSRDYRNSRWGKWRPSAGARRLGREAVALETLTERDGFDLEEAVEILRRNLGAGCSRQKLLDLAAALPQRPGRCFESTERLELASPGPGPQERLEDRDRRRTLRRIRRALSRALAQLGEDDRELLQLHFGEGLTLADVARRLRVPQRPLYTRRDRCLAQLRQELQGEGLDWRDVEPLIGWRQAAPGLLEAA